MLDTNDRKPKKHSNFKLKAEFTIKSQSQSFSFIASGGNQKKKRSRISLFFVFNVFVTNELDWMPSQLIQLTCLRMQISSQNCKNVIGKMEEIKL